MEIHCLGLSHKTASLQLLEAAYFTEEQVRAALARCGCRPEDQESDLLELTLLSTCNRVELYGVLAGDSAQALYEILTESSELDSDMLAPHLYHYSGLDSVRHLLRVASGLDSMVTGEPQILGQVADAHALALQVGASSTILNKVFQAAVHAGKRARSESGIATKPATTSSVAVHFAASIVPQLAQANVLVLGAGEMAELAVEALRKRGVRSLTVLNRTVSTARQLADRWGAEAKSFEQLLPALAAADILITSTGAPHTILHKESVEEVTAGRRGRPLVLLDIAVPRDIDPAVSDLPNVHLFDLETLDQHLQGSLQERQAEIPKVERILEEEFETFAAWHQSLRIRPVIAALHQRAETIRAQEVERTLAHLDEVTPEAKEQIEAMSRALVKKLLHGPTMRLKERSQNGSVAAYTLVARDLLDLDAEDSEGTPADS